jgi:hypothetical protein
MARIFINYRRDDTQGVAGRLFDYLASKYSRDELFMDVDAMQPGLDFAKQLDTQVSQCHVLLAVIGPHWIEAHDQAGHRRLDNDRDSVRVELASALQRDIAVIPVLVDGAVMPSEDSLPDNLKALSRRHALELRHTRFNADADAIMHALERVVPRRRAPLLVAGAGIAALLLVAIAGGVMWRETKTKPVVAPAGVQTSPVVAAVPPNAPTATVPALAAAPIQRPTPPSQAPANAASQGWLPPGFKLGEIVPNAALRGSYYHVVGTADVPSCQAACRADIRCAAWTYIQPKTGGTSVGTSGGTSGGTPGNTSGGASGATPGATAGICSFKAVIPQQFTDACCSSGVERMPDPELRTPPPIPAGVTGMLLPGVELEGGTYRYFGNATIDGCQAACRSDSQCMAWDYVRPGILSNDARCFLKNKLSMQIESPCCVAGFEQHEAAVQAPANAAAPPTHNIVMANTDLVGLDYRNFDPAAADATLCQNACKAENRCASWTYVHPGAQGPNPRCWLKSGVPQATSSSCCTSGIERADTK